MASGFEKQWIENRGITVIRKVDPATRAGKSSKVALVLAGGAVTGGAYKLGGIRALNDFLVSRSQGRVSRPFSVNDFDIFVGLSAGAVFASAISAGIPPRELFRILDGTTETFVPFKPLSHFMRPNVTEFIDRLDGFVRKEAEVWANWLKGLENVRTGERYDLSGTMIKATTVLMRLIPTGAFSPWGLEQFLRENLSRTGLSNHFVEAYQQTGKELYLTAVDINTGKKVVFGHEERYRDVPITHATVASCGIPFWFRTVRLKNPLVGQPGERRHLDLADGGIVRTANVRIALARGADLVICYNPFRAIHYDNLERSLYEHGAYALLNQAMRILLGSRLDLARSGFYNDPSVKADIVYIEPSPDDYDFFLMNPLNVWARQQAAMHGFLNVRSAIEGNFDLLKDVFRTHGVTLSRRRADRDAELLEASREDGQAIQEVMESAG